MKWVPSRLHPYNEPLYVKCEKRLSFLDVMDYYKVLMVNWNLFADIFNSRSVLEKHFLDLKNFRNSVKHNRNIDAVERKNGEAAILWFEKIFENLN